MYLSARTEQYHGDTGVTGDTGVRGDTGVPGSSWTVVETSANTAALDGYQYFCNTLGGGFTITLPATPSIGDTLSIVDGRGSFADNPIVVSRNGSNINGSADDLTLNLSNIEVVFLYSGDPTRGWSVTVSDLILGKGDTGIKGDSGVGWVIAQVSSNTNAVVGYKYFCDTTSSGFTITLPSTPAVGDLVAIVDANGTFASNPIVVSRNGNSINGEAEDVTLNLNSVEVTLTYSGVVGRGWILSVGDLTSGLQGDTGPAGIGWIMADISSNTDAVVNYKYFCDTSAGGFTVTLPANPATGALVSVVDAHGTFYTNNIIIARNNSRINAEDEDLTIDLTNAEVTFTYSGQSDRGWLVSISDLIAAVPPQKGDTGERGDPGINWVVVEASSNINAVVGRRYFCDTSSGSFTITLMVAPVVGDMVSIVDALGTFGTNALVVDGNGKNISGSADDLSLNISTVDVTFTYSGDATKGWLVFPAFGLPGF